MNRRRFVQASAGATLAVAARRAAKMWSACIGLPVERMRRRRTGADGDTGEDCAHRGRPVAMQARAKNAAGAPLEWIEARIF
jgi:hypothetical protein